MKAMDATLRRQRGLSLVGLIFVGLIVVFLMLIGFKLVPAVTEYLAIERAVNKIRTEASTVPEIRAAFDRHALIDDIKSISSRDLQITKESDKIVISYAYKYSIPIMENVNLVIDFSGRSSSRPAAN